MAGSEPPDIAGPRDEVPGQEIDYFNPNLSVRDLLLILDKRFFWGELRKVRVRWSSTMTSVAGLCIYDERRDLCTIKLSKPLLGRGSRKHLVEALLHEMIHAYLFVTKNFTNDTDDHGLKYQTHMIRINKEAGLNVHVYFKSSNESSINENDIRRHAGLRRHKHPNSGYVRRTINRPPVPSDCWRHSRKREHGRRFGRIPDGGKNVSENKNDKANGKETVVGVKGTRIFYKSFGPENPPTSKPSDAPSDAPSDSTPVDESDKGECSRSNEKNEAGNASKTEEEPGTSQSSDGFQSKPGTSRSSDDFQSKAGPSQTGDEPAGPRTRRLKKTSGKGKKRKSSDEAVDDNAPAVEQKRRTISCPVCHNSFAMELINDHVNACLEEQEFMNEISPDEYSDYEDYEHDQEYDDGHDQEHDDGHDHPPGQCPLLRDYEEGDESHERIATSLYFYVHDEELIGDDEPSDGKVRCPCCSRWVTEGRINEHIDACLTYYALQNPESP